jgi:2-polyprenyl-6-methoxyphenol hydroxylase-like FAD-dependent oxidoreductase
MSHRSEGRVILLVDAGYNGSPIGGNGTSMALVGAYILAGELAISDGSYQEAFALSEHVMRCQRFAKWDKESRSCDVKSTNLSDRSAPQLAASPAHARGP